MIRRLKVRLLRDDRGVTVIELVVASGIFLILLLAILQTLDSGTRSERVSQARHDALVDLRQAMTKMTAELRQATSIDPDPTKSNASRLDMMTLLDGNPIHVVYEVVGTPPNAVLKRTVGTSSPVNLATRIQAPQAFCYQYNDPTCLASTPITNMSSVRISLSIDPVVLSAGTVTLATDVELRNVN